MPQRIDTTSIAAQAARLRGLVPSLKAELAGHAAAIQEAVRVALEADANADEATVAAVNAAIAAADADFGVSIDELAAALVTNPSPEDPPPVELPPVE